MRRALIVAALVAIVVLRSLVSIGPAEVGLVTKKFSLKKLGDDDIVNVFVTRYQRDDGVVRATVKFARRLAQEAGYTVDEDKIGGVRLLRLEGNGELWALWSSKGHVVKVGGRGRTKLPGGVIEFYGDRYPSTVPAGSLEGPLPAGPDGRRQFDRGRGNKADKLDLEACVAIDDALIALGSDSGLAIRRQAAVVDARGARLVALPRLYAALRQPVLGSGALNLEGATVVADALVLGHVGDDLTLNEATRRFLEEDEYLVRRRVHRDVGAVT